MTNKEREQLSEELVECVKKHNGVFNVSVKIEPILSVDGKEYSALLLVVGLEPDEV